MKRAVRDTGMAAALVLAWAWAGIAGAEPIRTGGTIEAVTVYRGQALVTRRIPLDALPGGALPGGLPGGLREVVVTSLPPTVIGASLYAEASEGVTVRSIRYRERAVEADVREDVRKLDEEIQAVRDRISGIEQQESVLEQKGAYLDRLGQFAAATSSGDMSRGVLNAETLTKLTEYQFQQRVEMAKQRLALGVDAREAKKQLALLERRRAEVSRASSATEREAVIFVDVGEVPGAGERSLAVRYLVGQADWSPSYNVRAEAESDRVVLEYAAQVTQMSGEDWENVRMSLSTASAALVAEAPRLDPVAVSLASAQAAAQSSTLSVDAFNEYKASNRGESLQVEQMRQQQAMLMSKLGDPYASTSSRYAGRPAVQAPGEDMDSNVRLNRLALDLQMLEIRAAADGPLAESPARQQQTVSVTYTLPQTTSLPSRDDQQLIAIATLPMEAEYQRLAAPVLTPYVYRQAEARNSGDVVLLAGPVTSYLDGQFVGRGTIPTVAVGERFTVGFGIDPSLRTSRQLLEKKDDIRGGNRVLTFRYRVSVEGFGDEPVKGVRLQDRIPTAGESQVDVALLDAKPQRINAEDARALAQTGLLEWRIDSPGAAEYTYTLTFDKQMSISGVPVQR